MNATENPPKPSQPLRGLTAKLAAAGRRMQREKAAAFALSSWPWLCGAVLALIAADVVLHLSAGWRVALGRGLLGLAAAFFIAALAIALRRRSRESVARELEARSPQLGTKLLNALQLDAQAADERLAPITRSLAAQAVGDYAGRLEKENLPALAKTDRAWRAAKHAAIGAAGLAALLFVCSDITRTVWARFADPFGDHPAFSFTRVAIVEPVVDGAQVLYGANISVTALATGHQPAELLLSFHPPGQPGAKRTVPMFSKGDGKFSQQIENIRSEIIAVVHTKDGRSISQQRRIGVQLVPQFDKAFVKITPPAYTGLRPTEQPFHFKALKALRGSTVAFRLQSNRPLRDGAVEFWRGESSEGSVKLTPSAELETEVAGAFAAAETGRLRFSLTDIDGFSAAESPEAPITVTNDLAPEVRLVEPPQDGFVTEEYRLKVVLEASDDYGVKRVRFHAARNDKFGDPAAEEIAAVETSVRRTFAFCLVPELETLSDIAGFENLASSPKPPPKLEPGEVLLKVKPGDKLSFFAEVTDTAPEPHMARSQVLNLHVISTEDYNQYLRERLDMADIAEKYTQLFNELHELVDEQKQLAAEAEKAREQLEKADTDAKKAAAQRKLDELLARQNELNQKLKKLAENMDDFVRDDPVYDVEEQLAETLQKKAQEIRDSTAENDAANKALAGKNQPTNGQSAPSPKQLADFKKSAEEQAEKLGGEKPQQEEQQVAEMMEDLSELHEIVKNMNQFQELTKAQRQLADQMKAYNKKGEPSREEQLAMKDMAAAQEEIRKQTEELEHQLTESATAAEEKFPKAAQSARDLAQAIADIDVPKLAGKSGEALLEGKGQQGSELTERLAGEMEKLFAEQCQNPQPGMAGELDQYMQLTRGGSAGDTFKQMLQSKKFGQGKGKGQQMGQGEGQGGTGGFMMTPGTQAPVLGNENAIANDSRNSSKGISRGGKPTPEGTPATAKSGSPEGMLQGNRESDAVAGESDAERYRGLVEQYFKAITAPKK